MIGIYKITNLINGKCYIGQSVNIKQRWTTHLKDAFWENGPEYNYPLYQAFRKYGVANFSFEVLEECSKDALNEREIFYIAKYNAYSKGYNQNAGGNSNPHPQKLTQEQVLQIIILLKTTNKTSEEIAYQFNVSGATIRNIHLGTIWHQPNESYPIRDRTTKQSQNTCAKCGANILSTSIYCKKCSNLVNPRYKKVKERPNQFELAKMIVESSFVKVGKHFGVSDNTIKQWCKNYGMPTKKVELVDWYQKNIESLEYYVAQKATYNSKRPVKQIDIKTGEVLAVFNSVSEASRAVGCANSANISDVCRGIYKSSHGYFWQFA